ncbi:repeat protein [Moumouvirus goulette]|uniref:Repeat protein n=1 Tax=Moumouvirus goulette TaxID=1247379 RepID=M1PLZ6_9VIRU|nr:repeat protein [Moumouvirus goulette]AGF84921.1 repeat protein [Moumouvirus goulette]
MSNHYFNIRVEKPQNNRVYIDKKNRKNKKFNKSPKKNKKDEYTLMELYEKYKVKRKFIKKNKCEIFNKPVTELSWSIIKPNNNQNEKNYPGATIIPSKNIWMSLHNNIYPNIYPKMMESFPIHRRMNIVHFGRSLFYTKDLFYKITLDEQKKIEIYNNNNQDVALFKLLLINHKEFKKDRYGVSSLMYACKLSENDGNLKVIKFLIDLGLDVNDKDTHGNTALMYLLQGKSQIDNKLVDKNNIQSIKLLLDSGADFNASNIIGNTISDYLLELDYQKSINILEILEILLDRGLNPTDYLLKIMSNNKYHNNVPIIKLLLKYGADVNFKFPQNNLNDIIMSWYYLYDEKRNSFMKFPRQNWTIFTNCLYNYIKNTDHLPIVKLFLDYDADYNLVINILDPTSHWELFEIVYSIASNKNYFKTIKNELNEVCNEILFRPGSIRSKVICANLTINTSGIFHDQMLWNYFGINNAHDFILKIEQNRRHIE